MRNSVDERNDPNVEISGVSRVEPDFINGTHDLVKRPVSGLDAGPYAVVDPSKAVGFMAMCQRYRVADSDGSVM